MRALAGWEGVKGSFHGNLEVVKDELSLLHNLAKDYSRFCITQHMLCKKYTVFVVIWYFCHTELFSNWHLEICSITTNEVCNDGPQAPQNA